MTLTAPVVSVREVNPGSGVGYGLRYTTSHRSRLALLPLGYADGIPRAISPDARVLLRGRRVPIAGIVSMDQIVVDAGDAGVEPGETVTVFGPGDEGEPTLREWAGWAGTIEHELVTRIGPRVGRETVNLSAAAPVTSLRITRGGVAA
jgi:alanine racemase